MVAQTKYRTLSHLLSMNNAVDPEIRRFQNSRTSSPVVRAKSYRTMTGLTSRVDQSIQSTNSMIPTGGGKQYRIRQLRSNSR